MLPAPAREGSIISAKKGEVVKIRYPSGYSGREGFSKIAVSFPQPVFNTIIARAKRENKTFNDMVVELVKVGELDLSDSDRHEPKRKRNVLPR